MEGLIEQMGADYREFNRLREKVRSGQGNGDEGQDLFRLLGCLKAELSTFRELEGREIESVNCSLIRQIEKEMNAFVLAIFPSW
jgi:hypothetical protein